MSDQGLGNENITVLVIKIPICPAATCNNKVLPWHLPYGKHEHSCEMGSYAGSLWTVAVTEGLRAKAKGHSRSMTEKFHKGLSPKPRPSTSVMSTQIGA